MEHISCNALLCEKHECPSKLCLQVNRKNYVLIQQSIDIFKNDSHDYNPQESDNRVSLGLKFKIFCILISYQKP